jgi:hypothetical protein
MNTTPPTQLNATSKRPKARPRKRKRSAGHIGKAAKAKVESSFTLTLPLDADDDAATASMGATFPAEICIDVDPATTDFTWIAAGGHSIRVHKFMMNTCSLVYQTLRTASPDDTSFTSMRSDGCTPSVLFSYLHAAYPRIDTQWHLITPAADGTDAKTLPAAFVPPSRDGCCAHTLMAYANWCAELYTFALSQEASVAALAPFASDIVSTLNDMCVPTTSRLSDYSASVGKEHRATIFRLAQLVLGGTMDDAHRTNVRWDRLYFTIANVPSRSSAAPHAKIMRTMPLCVSHECARAMADVMQRICHTHISAYPAFDPWQLVDKLTSGEASKLPR